MNKDPMAKKYYHHTDVQRLVRRAFLQGAFLGTICCLIGVWLVVGR